MAALCLNFNAFAQVTIQNLKGKIIDESGIPIPGLNVSIKNTKTHFLTDKNGVFMLNKVEKGATLKITGIGYQSVEITNIQDGDLGTITIQTDNTRLNEVEIVSTGYQSIPKERATGSFVQIDNKLLNRSVTTNILDRLAGVTSGLIFNKNISVSNNSNPSSISIRGRSTIYANPNPLIVIDNFPYTGDLSSINPNDIESITVLKDAAAASIWGAFSGNGVIVITSKKGKYNQAPSIEFNTSMTIGEKPNLFYTPRLSSENYIAIEQFLFQKGYYNSAITRSSHPVLSPVVDILVNRRNKLISAADSAKLINQYKGQDTRSEQSAYLYRQSVNQQYSLGIKGGGNNNLYYFSAGFNKDLSNLKGNDFNRITINASDTYTFLNKKIQWTNSVYFTKEKTSNNGVSPGNLLYPYLKLKDEKGNNLSVPYQYRQGYIDTAGRGNLLDWHYRPLDELGNNDNTTKLTEYRYNTQLRYNIFNGFDASLQYQYDEGNSVQSNLYNQDSYYARDYINQFTQYNKTTGIYTMPVPIGGILDNLNKTFSSQNFRGQLNYTHQWNDKHGLSALAGYEIRDINATFKNSRLYGYDDLGNVALIDYTPYYKYFYSSGTGRIAQNASQSGTVNRFISYFANFSYTYKNRYIISASGRKDKSNIFGVSTNQKGVPLWSVGGSWEINKEPFYHLNWLPYVRLRVTNGYNGNVDNTLSSSITAIVGSGNAYNQPYSTLTNPPNPLLRWEKVNTTNFGLDFSLKKVLSGTIEYYIKKGSDLIGTSNVDPTVGVSIFKGNSANMQGHGIDVSLNSRNIEGAFGWNTTLLFSYSTNKVTKYLLKSASVSSAVSSGLNPVEGNPLYSLYSFKWAGLDAKGDPQVYYNNEVSKKYSDIYNSTDLSNLQYSGPANPTTFGSLRNEFSYKGFTLSANIIYKLGYYFRRPSLNSSNVFTGQLYFPDAEYTGRWQKAGDEKLTQIPALSYPADAVRDQIYKYSDILIEKGDHIRLQDISLNYEFTKGKFSGLPVASLSLYGYISNVGILWKANKAGLDPDYVPNGAMIYPNPRTYSIGVRAKF